MLLIGGKLQTDDHRRSPPRRKRGGKQAEASIGTNISEDTHIECVASAVLISHQDSGAVFLSGR